MTMLDLFVTEFRQLRAAADEGPRNEEGSRLRRKLVRKEIGMAIVALGAMAMFFHAAQGFAFLGT
ncbi:hypothetical protein D3C87_1122060 [compost metagenome]|uniref:Uncharacterized protein n=1 Tax=Cupriavidus campinensis TaxID=151783 RepID=A0AAE9L1T5_9BURK|nr:MULTISPECIES: hypothetical protein [Cupriavidus]TSP09814.1 hypothetical protein FGG12_26045 [Cupriavidus campinensis]URF03629.1 hypothetical protein M5D45_14065 [Cupriavidus campinensis]CAG2151771.1 hypothetical protein LMG19282_04053 [Cupriavidus campinensis]